jgi:hypothetical protein
MASGTYLLEPGDFRIRLACRAITAALIAATGFEAVMFVSKETPGVYDHAPWLNDPYDTAVSFALFCVPLIVVPCAIRLLACRGGRPMPASRLSDLLRAAGTGLGVVALTLAAGWSALALGANRAAWSPVTGVQAGFLAVLTAVTVACAGRIRSASIALRPEVGADDAAGAATAPDWLTDLLDVGLLAARALGPAGRPAVRLHGWLASGVVPAVRRHPLAAAALIAAGVAAGISASQAVSEGYRAAVSLVFFCVAAAGLFAFVAAAGCYLRIVRSDQPARRGSRPLVHAVVLACAAVPAALAFRAALWSMVGANPQRSGLPALCLLLAAAAAITFGLTLAAERFR